MNIRLKEVIQYLVILAATVFLVWFSLQAITVEEGQNKWDYLYATWQQSDKGWMFLMVFFFMLSNVLRAERWRMLLRSSGHNTSLFDSFVSLMTGYLVNLVIPRGGEVSRCYNLYKLNTTPVEVSFGTVIVERVIDVICMLLVLLLAFALEFDKLTGFVSTLPIQSFDGRSKVLTIVVLISAGLAGGWLAIYLVKRNPALREKLRSVWAGFKKGIKSIARLQAKWIFFLHSIVIWLLYFLMSYAVIRAFDETGSLGMQAVLSIFAIGVIAMATPLPGGTGSYHLLLPAGLVFLYQLPRTDAVAFTFVFHGWQTLILVITGVICLVLSGIKIRKPRISND